MEKVESFLFKEIPVDFYRHEGKYYMTAEDIGKCFGFKNPRKQINNLYAKTLAEDNPEYSIKVKANNMSGGELRFFSREGIEMLCFKNPSRAEFARWVNTIMNGLESDVLTTVPTGEVDLSAFRTPNLTDRETCSMTEYERAKVLLSAAALYPPESNTRKGLVSAALKFAAGRAEEIDFESLL